MRPFVRLTAAPADDYVKPSPAHQRAVLEAVDALRKAGHECIEIQVPDGALFSFL